MQYFLHDWCHKVALNYMMNFCFLLLMLFGFYWIRLLFYIYCECYFRKLSKFEKSKKNMMPANNWHCDAHFANNLYSLGILVSNWAKIEWEFVLNVEKKKRWHCYGYADCWISHCLREFEAIKLNNAILVFHFIRLISE